MLIRCLFGVIVSIFKRILLARTRRPLLSPYLTPYYRQGCLMFCRRLAPKFLVLPTLTGGDMNDGTNRK
jgi:hypothetical protein